ncbi:MAG: S-ribosylhomocysteine lyase [Clostridia bacterium]|nr:S-ribosylhomocysteine lyase [Clostridia bacterium]
MHKITSFTIDHNILKEGFYLSRKDGDIFTYDLRFKKPNCGDYISTAVMHTIEHLVATTLRNGNKKDSVIYFGPMGCGTGFYALFRDIEKDEAKQFVETAIIEALKFDEIPGNKKIECGNYRSHNLSGAKSELKQYLNFLK